MIDEEQPVVQEISDFQKASRAPVAFGVLLFGFGAAAGGLFVVSGRTLLKDGAATVVNVFLLALLILVMVGILIFLFRGAIMRRLFGMADAQVEKFAVPLAEVAERTAARDAVAATHAARDLIRLTAARYAWVSTRRWLIASLTGLIAAMAALAGTALLFSQNELLTQQNELLAKEFEQLLEQNRKLEAQTTSLEAQTDFLEQDIQLAEAARNAELAVEVTNIADLLGQAMLRAEARARSQGAEPNENIWAELVPVLDPLQDIDKRLVMRITSASRAMKPYRFLATPFRAYDDYDKLRVAMEPRRLELPKAYAGSAKFFGWPEPLAEGEDAGPTRLIDRPASPERGQLLQTMIRSGLRDYEMLNWFGLDLSFAVIEDFNLLGISIENAMLAYARFDRAQINGSSFRGGALENTSFHRTRIVGSDFSSVFSEDAKGPYKADGEVYNTTLAGADFSEAILEGVNFSNTHSGSTIFDGASLTGVNFSGTNLGAATFRGAVLIDVDFGGAFVGSVEFDGAYVFGEDFLDRMAGETSPGSFKVGRFELEPANLDEVLEIRPVFLSYEPEGLIQATGGKRVFRVRRVGEFESD